ncbi:MAG: hypothetical protein IVW56_00990 [Candidatus Binataceae bacterium]|nr:hypothetical protein [Candidatus Binataceae bacterium]
MPEFWKQPKFWGAAIIVLWLSYIIGGNLAQTVTIHVVPWLVQPILKVSSIVIWSAIVGAGLTLLIQYYWRKRRSSKYATQSTPAPGASSSTVA